MWFWAVVFADTTSFLYKPSQPCPPIPSSSSTFFFFPFSLVRSEPMSQSVGDVLQPPDSSQSLTTATSQSDQQQSLALTTSESARHRRKIAVLEGKIQVLESGHALKKRYESHLISVRFTHVCIVRETNYYMSQGRAIRRLVTLYDNIEDLVTENDRRCDLDDDEDMTLE